MSKVRTSLRRMVRAERIPRNGCALPDLDEFRRWQDAAQGNIRLVTLSPEWPEAAALYRHGSPREGVAVSIGHTKATRQQIQDAVSAGATLSTHLGNGAHATLPRHPNYIWEQLAEDRLAASFIVDGHHLPDSFLRVALRAKGIERSILVTDAVAPAMCAPGDYRLGEVDIELRADGRVTLTRRRTPGRLELAHGPRHRQRDADRRRLAGRSRDHGDAESGARGAHWRTPARVRAGRSRRSGALHPRGRPSCACSKLS